jgi:hypothetical protein
MPVLIQQITLPERFLPERFDEFAEFMRDEYFPAVEKGPWRTGAVIGLALLRKAESQSNTFLMHVSFESGVGGPPVAVTGVLEVNEEVQRKFESFGPRVERPGVVYDEVALWPEDAEA